jgi:lipopolysaccharide/colanic/teichoic acid biosynthesis glycosyltransferase
MNSNMQTPSLESSQLDRLVGFDLTQETEFLSSAPPTSQLVWSPTPRWKRAVDVVVSAIALVLLSPLLFLIACYIRLVSRGPSIFKQSRLGEMGRPFTIYKFRTMHSGDPDVATSEHREYVSSRAELDEVIAKPDLTHRLIPGGAFLRRRSLDELPQLANVLVGNMSLIGPRPDVLDWEDYTAWQQKRFEVKPGISGLWQVSGKNRLSFSRMMELDIEYIERRSFWFDMWIAIRTVRLLISKDNC